MVPRLSFGVCDSENLVNAENAEYYRSEKSARYFFPGSGIGIRDVLICPDRRLIHSTAAGNHYKPYADSQIDPIPG